MTEAVPDELKYPNEEWGDYLIEASGVSLSLDDRQILDRVDIGIGRREIVTLIGPNGAGKTMLIRMLLGLRRPDTGDIRRIDGLTIGYLPQRISVDPTLPLTVERMLGLTNSVDREAGRAELKEVGAEHLADAMMHDLSGGELQRVMLARAMLRNPDLLVLDEPVQGVDFSGELDLYELIARIRDRRGCGILLVSHDLHLVMASTDRVVCLNHHICCAGHPEAVKRDPEYLALFGRRAAESLAVYAHVHDHDHDLSGDVLGHDHP
ncbi:MAG: ATP-binding cassette domain-containing protein [Alphaproteobacteria bacterium]|mgnify:CR=1 FL=1|nr:ATP-binding cassette domain-containing protein [Alphaproteobacteria bacterium]